MGAWRSAIKMVPSKMHNSASLFWAARPVRMLTTRTPIPSPISSNVFSCCSTLNSLSKGELLYFSQIQNATLLSENFFQKFYINFILRRSKNFFEILVSGSDEKRVLLYNNCCERRLLWARRLLVTDYFLRRDMDKYECIACGYIYDPQIGDPENGVAAGTPFEDLPDDWVCPDCGVGKDQFEKIG